MEQLYKEGFKGSSSLGAVATDPEDPGALPSHTFEPSGGEAVGINGSAMCLCSGIT